MLRGLSLWRALSGLAALSLALASTPANADEYDEPASPAPAAKPTPTPAAPAPTAAPAPASADDAALGAAARALLGEIARLACSRGGAEAVPATCGAAQSTPSLASLRAAALADALSLAVAHLPLSPAAKSLTNLTAPEALDTAAVAARWREVGRAHGLEPQATEAAVARAQAALQEARRAHERLARAQGSARVEAARAWLAASVAIARELAALVEGKAAPSAAPAADARQDLLLRVVALENDDDVKALARSLLLPLPPWTERVLFDANATFPVLGKETLLDGDLLLGYGGDTFGVSGFGSLYHHAYDTPQGQRTVVDRYEGRAEGVWWPALSDDLKLELRLRGGVLLYDSGTSGRFLVGSGTVRPDETSLVGHGGASVGLRGRGGPRFAYAVSAGGGVQWEDFSAADATGKELVLRNASPVVARGEARLRAQWNVAPSYLALRARADANLLALSTVKDTTTATATSLLTVRDVEESQRFELFTRLFVDVDALGFFGFRPSAHVGVDVFAGDVATAVVPVLGGGLRRESF